MLINDEFIPGRGLKNAHVQTMFSSLMPHRWSATRRFDKYRKQQQDVILDCGEDSRLQGFLNQSSAQAAKRLVIMIHGWEGCHESHYMLSASKTMLDAGVDVFRLNLRDHGGTQHLNRGLFYSTLIDEVITAIQRIQQKFNYDDYFLAGFSLGGNFVLRVAALAHATPIRLNKVLAFCPVIHAGESNEALNKKSNWFYNQYFTRRWRRSLLTKTKYWPEYGFESELATLKDLNAMNLALIPKYTGFAELDDYFNAYAIDGDFLSKTIAPCYLHFAADDMIIPVIGISDLADNSDLHVTVTRYGGHCGFIQDWQGLSWQSQRLLQMLS